MAEYRIKNGVLEKYRGDAKNVIIPDGITVIADEAFMGCVRIRSITVPDGVKEIGKKAFDECLELEKISLPESVEKIGAVAFNWCENLREINIPDKVEYIEQKTFQWCRKLTSIHLPANLKKIDESSFLECDSLEEIEIPEKVVYIGQNTFKHCDRLKKVIVHDLAPLTIYAVSDCFRLKYITVRGKKVQIDMKISDDVFDFIKAGEKTKEKLFRKNKTCKIVFAYFLAMEYGNETAENYLRNNFIETAKYFTDTNDSANMTLFLPYISGQYIDELIHYAIDKKKPEIQLILTKYKHDCFGFDTGDSFDKFLL